MPGSVLHSVFMRLPCRHCPQSCLHGPLLDGTPTRLAYLNAVDAVVPQQLPQAHSCDIDGRTLLPFKVTVYVALVKRTYLVCPARQVFATPAAVESITVTPHGGLGWNGTRPWADCSIEGSRVWPTRDGLLRLQEQLRNGPHKYLWSRQTNASQLPSTDVT